jgi:ferric iron reductase protein FhuF
MSTTPARTLDTQELEQRVKQMYQEVALKPGREHPNYRFVSERADNAVRKYGATSISVFARHPE